MYMQWAGSWFAFLHTCNRLSSQAATLEIHVLSALNLPVLKWAADWVSDISSLKKSQVVEKV